MVSARRNMRLKYALINETFSGGKILHLALNDRKQNWFQRVNILNCLKRKTNQKNEEKKKNGVDFWLRRLKQRT